jgi:hypothetical protein
MRWTCPRGSSRRIFSKEFKLAAVGRLEQAVSIGEVALERWKLADLLTFWQAQPKSASSAKEGLNLMNQAGEEGHAFTLGFGPRFCRVRLPHQAGAAKRTSGHRPKHLGGTMFR